MQDPKCRDAWAAILFYAQLIAVCCVCGILGVPAVQRSLNDGGGGQQEEQEGAMDYTGLIYGKKSCSVVIFCVFLFVLIDFKTNSSQYTYTSL